MPKMFEHDQDEVNVFLLAVNVYENMNQYMSYISFYIFYMLRFMVFNVSFNNISFIS